MLIPPKEAQIGEESLLGFRKFALTTGDGGKPNGILSESPQICLMAILASRFVTKANACALYSDPKSANCKNKSTVCAHLSGAFISALPASRTMS